MLMPLSPPPYRLGRWFMVCALTFYVLPIVVIMSGRFAVADKLVALAILAGSGVIWTWLWTRIIGGPDARFKTVAVVLLAALMAVFDLMTPPQYGSLFFYLVVILGAAYPWRVAVPLVVIASVGAGSLDLVRGTSGIQAFGDVINEGIVGLAAVAGRLLVEANRQLSVAREEIARLAVDEERLRFARDLHDLLGHSLSVIAMKSELARRLISRSAGLAEHEVEDIERVAREALREVRDAVAGYRQPTLATELAGAKAALTAGNIELSVDAPSTPIPPAVEAVLAWAVREGATNVLRHSRATRCAIRVQHDVGTATVEVTDNGTGLLGSASASGSGLRGLRERVEQRGGQLEAGSLPHEGYRLRVTLPLQQPAFAEAAEVTSRSA